MSALLLFSFCALIKHIFVHMIVLHKSLKLQSLFFILSLFASLVLGDIPNFVDLLLSSPILSSA